MRVRSLKHKISTDESPLPSLPYTATSHPQQCPKDQKWHEQDLDQYQNQFFLSVCKIHKNYYISGQHSTGICRVYIDYLP